MVFEAAEIEVSFTDAPASRPSVADGVAAALERWHSLVSRHEEPSPSTDERESTSPKIAVVDDEPLNAAEIAHLLTEAGFRRCAWTADTHDAVPFLRRERPDVVLLDLTLSEIDGIDLLRQLRDDERLSHVPTIVLTGARRSRASPPRAGTRRRRLSDQADRSDRTDSARSQRVVRPFVSRTTRTTGLRAGSRGSRTDRRVGACRDWN